GDGDGGDVDGDDHDSDDDGDYDVDVYVDVGDIDSLPHFDESWGQLEQLPSADLRAMQDSADGRNSMLVDEGPVAVLSGDAVLTRRYSLVFEDLADLDIAGHRGDGGP